MEIVGIILIPLALAFIGIYVTNRTAFKIGKETANAVTKAAGEMIRAAREDGVNCIEKDIEALAKETKTDVEAVVKAIQASGEQTLKSIEKDGAETRQTIIKVHQSIKDELGK